MRDFESACRLDDVYDGFAHIIERGYDDRFQVCYGRVGLACAAEDVAALMTRREVALQLPDGQSMMIRLQQPHPSSEDGAVEFYFVSTAPLVNLASLFSGFLSAPPVPV